MMKDTALIILAIALMIFSLGISIWAVNEKEKQLINTYKEETQ